MKWPFRFFALEVLISSIYFVGESYGEVKMIWKYPQTLNIPSHVIIEKIEKNSTCDLSAVDDNVTIDSLQVVFMTKRCISGYCRNPIRDRGVNGLMLIECSDIFNHVQDFGMDTVALLEDQCNACSNEKNDSSIVDMKNLEIEDKNPWWSVGYWNFWKNSPSK